jgi:hypothetical protein
MLITRQIVADKLAAYLQHRQSLEQLVDWAEQEMMDGEFESVEARDAVARLGLSDVRAFGLTWEDCERILRELGYSAQVQIGTA